MRSAFLHVLPFDSFVGMTSLRQREASKQLGMETGSLTVFTIVF